MPKAPLTSAEVAAIAEPGTEAQVGVHRVDRGLYLQVKPNGARSWLLRYTLRGRERQMGLGPLRLVSPTMARREAIKYQRLLLQGVDPIDARKAEQAAPDEPLAEPVPAVAAVAGRTARGATFAECATEYIADREAGWKNAKHIDQWRSTIRTSPTILRRQV